MAGPNASTMSLVGGKTASLVFVLMLTAFVSESQLTQYVQANLSYRQPVLLFYFAHSSMCFVFPLHLLYLRMTTSRSFAAHLRGLSMTVSRHLSLTTDQDTAFPALRLFTLITWLTIGLTIPGLLWFAAITLASVSDVTAIWNSNAFWAYVVSVKLQQSPWDYRRLLSVLIASVSVLAVVYGSEPPVPDAGEFTPSRDNFDKPKAPLLGNLLTLIASFIYALYQVMYKVYGVPEGGSEYENLPWQRRSYASELLEDGEVIDSAVEDLTMKHDMDVVYPVPFGLYANMITSGIGLMTLLVLWIPLPILNHLGIEPFSLPKDLLTTCVVAGIALSGVTFYMSFMILLGVWGPIITSVGSLLSIVLVMLSDMVFGSAAETITAWSLVGSGMIICAFAVLAFDTLRA